MTAPRTTELCRNCCFAALFVLIRKSNMWPLAPPRPCDCYPAEPAGARHAASVRSRTIMKRQSLAGTTADFSNVRLGPFLPRLTESTADRWLKATTQLFLTFNGEENGRCTPGVQPQRSSCFLTWLFYTVDKLQPRFVVTGSG